MGRLRQLNPSLLFGASIKCKLIRRDVIWTRRYIAGQHVGSRMTRLADFLPTTRKNSLQRSEVYRMGETAQKPRPADVRFGSKADIGSPPAHVCFTPVYEYTL